MTDGGDSCWREQQIETESAELPSLKCSCLIA